jgi:hypothetical protein
MSNYLAGSDPYTVCVIIIMLKIRLNFNSVSRSNENMAGGNEVTLKSMYWVC